MARKRRPRQLRHLYDDAPITLDDLRGRAPSTEFLGPAELTTDNASLDEIDDSELGQRRARSTATTRWLAAAAGLVLIAGAYGLTQGWQSDDVDTATVVPIDPNTQWVQIDQGDAFTPAEEEVPQGALRGPGFNGIFVTEIEKTSLGYFAIGVDQRPERNAAAVWRSGDGKSWERVADPDHLWGNLEEPQGADWAPQFASMWSLAETNGVVVIVGNYFDGSQSNSFGAAAWSTTDGLTWTESRLGDQGVGRMLRSVVGTDDGFVAVVDGSSGEAVTPPPMIWHSENGTDWEHRGSVGLPNPMIVNAVSVVDDDDSERLVLQPGEAPARWLPPTMALRRSSPSFLPNGARGQGRLPSRPRSGTCQSGSRSNAARVGVAVLCTAVVDPLRPAVRPIVHRLLRVE